MNSDALLPSAASEQHQEKPNDGSRGPWAAPIRLPQPLGVQPGGTPKHPGGHSISWGDAVLGTTPPRVLQRILQGRELGQGKEIAEKQNFHRVSDPRGCPAPPGRYSG